MSTFDIDQAAGTFSKSKPAVELAQDRYPMKLYTETAGENRNLLVEHNSVAGFIGLIGSDVRFLPLCKILQGENGPAEVIFNIGDKCAAGNISPVKMMLSAFLENVHVYLVPREDGVIFEHPVGKEVTLGEGDAAKKYHIATVPRVFPVEPHHGIVEGPVTSNEVAMSLQRYHPRAKEWLEAATYEVTYPNSTPGKNVVEADEMPHAPTPVDHGTKLQLDVSTLFAPAQPSPDHPYCMIQALANQVRNENVRAYVAQQGDGTSDASEGNPSGSQGHTPGIDNSSADAVRQLTQALRGAMSGRGGNDDDESICSAKNSSDWQRATIFYVMMGSRFGKDTASDGSLVEVVHPPSINENFREVFTGSSAANQGQSLRCLMEQHSRTERKSRDWIKRLTEFPHIDTFFAQMLKRCQWKTTALDEEAAQLKRQISVLMFKRQPVKGTGKQAYESHIAGTHQVENEASIGETTSNRTRMSTECFTGGRMETMSDYLALVANLLALFTLIYDFNWNTSVTQPTLVSYLMDEADQMDSTETRNWY